MRYPGRALATALGSLAFIVFLWVGAWRCPSAALFHSPCPGCGSTRAVRALFHADWHGVLLNPLAPLVSAAMGVLIVRAIWLEYVDGHTKRLDEAWGALATRAMLVFAVCELVIWVARWFGFLGGPVPV